MPKIVDHQERRRQIMEASLEVFLRRGYHGVSLRDLCREVGTNTGILYHYFHSKEDLFHKTVEYFCARDESEVMTQMAKISDPMDRIAAAIHLWERRGQEWAKLLMLWLDFVISTEDLELVRQRVGQLFKGYLAGFTRLFTDGVESGALRPIDPQTATDLLLSALDGILLNHYLRPEMDLNAVLVMFIDVLRRGLTAPVNSRRQRKGRMRRS